MIPLFDSFNRFLLKRRVIKAVEKEGFEVTNFEFMPKEVNDNSMSVKPLDDGFNHTDEFCRCKPEVRMVEYENGSTKLITHYDYYEITKEN